MDFLVGPSVADQVVFEDSLLLLYFLLDLQLLLEKTLLRGVEEGLYSTVFLVVYLELGAQSLGLSDEVYVFFLHCPVDLHQLSRLLEIHFVLALATLKQSNKAFGEAYVVELAQLIEVEPGGLWTLERGIWIG